nr:MAG TPA: hypothetical protein [Caudoviricetes sp.]
MKFLKFCKESVDIYMEKVYYISVRKGKAKAKEVR